MNGGKLYVDGRFVFGLGTSKSVWMVGILSSCLVVPTNGIELELCGIKD